jgi:hypothetical protein
MKRWLRQRDKFSCGPIALINLDKWRGKSVTNRDLPRYQRRCSCRHPRGTVIANFSRIVGRPHYRLNYRRFKQHLLSGGTAIINIVWAYGVGHFFFVRGVAERNDGRRGFLAVNFIEGETLTLLSWQLMVAMLREGRTWTFRP